MRINSKTLLASTATGVVALAAALVVTPVCAAPAPAPAPPAAGQDATALDVIAQAKAAMGGDAWDKLKGWHEVGIHNGARYETWLDLQQYGMATRETGPSGSTAHGFDGRVAWRLAADGAVTRDGSAEAVAAAEQSDYLRLSGYLLPDRFKAELAFVGTRDEASRTYDIVHVTTSGAGADIWFDRETHLPARVVIQEGPTTVTIRFADYRVVDGVAAPFHTMVSDGDPTHDDDARITALDFGAADDAVFGPPASDAPAN